MSPASPGRPKPDAIPGTYKSDREIADWLFISETRPIAYLSIAKCGSTFVKHLLWHIDHGEIHESGIESDTAIHDFDDRLPRGTALAVEDVQANPYAFTIVRNPVDRFLSLYFDKVAGDHDPGFEWFRKIMAGVDGIIADPRTVEDHRANCLAMIAWIGRNLAGQTAAPLNNHWRQQRVRVNMARKLNLAVLTLDGLNGQLRVLLGGIVPDIGDHLRAVTARNKVPRPISKAEIRTDELVAAIRSVYSHDHRIWTDAKTAWSRIDKSQPDPAAAPRLSLPYF